MKRFLLALVATVLALPTMAFETKVQTKSVGEVTISCQESAWSEQAKVVSKGDTEEISIEMTAPQPTKPSQLKVTFTTPQTDAHHLWHANRDCRMVLPPDWKGKFSSALAQNMPLYAFINSNTKIVFSIPFNI